MKAQGVPIKVLIVDDSALMRALLSEIINSAADLEVIGTAPDPLAAREMIKALNPDVLTLDIEMPKMDGLEFLSRLMKLRPMPVIMISSLTERGSEVTLQALELGAVDFQTKPRMESATLRQEYADEICEKIRNAYTARYRLVNTPSKTSPLKSPTQLTTQPPLMHESNTQTLGHRILNEKLIAIGASTGGTEAIKEVLQALPQNMPGIVITQHMPETFTTSFAKRLDSLSALHVIEAQGGEKIEPGHAYLAPGHSHLLVKKVGAYYFTELSKADPVNRHRPSVDVLFQSVAHTARQHAIGVILTGMGKDGAQGLLKMHQTGAWTIGQNQESCIVYGMPREAAEIGALDEALPLKQIAARLIARLKETERHS